MKDGVGKALDVRRRKLRVVGLLATDRCNSRCRHCLIWNKKVNHDLDVDVIAAMLDDPVIASDTYFELTGGEFLDHPRYRDILALFRGRDYMVLSNGMYPEPLVKAVRDFKIPHLYMSLDGLGATYKKVRGIDCADNIIGIIDELKHETEIFVGYCITPWNAVEDLVQVRDLCREKGVGFFVGAYQNPEFFDTSKPGGKIPEEHEPYLDEFMRLHNPWMEREVKIPCWNVRTKVYVMGNGDVHLCQQKSLVLGNLYEKSIGEIWNAPETLAIHEKYLHCNDCWLACNRPFDAELAHAARLLLPAAALERLVGDFTWNRVHESYLEGPAA
ncbi:MAG: SPASM domain-containing protein [Thermoanaerobaculia bacterium]|nr:SPASM domain-containing protein [Thermoanaerobaculia bacterium]